MAEDTKNVLFIYDSDSSSRVSKILERMVREDYQKVRPTIVTNRGEALRHLDSNCYDAVYIADTMLNDQLISQGIGLAPPEMYEGLSRNSGGFTINNKERDYCAACRQLVRVARNKNIPVVVGDGEPSYFGDILEDIEGARVLSAIYDSALIHYEAIMDALGGE